MAIVVTFLTAGPALGASSEVDLGSNGMLTYRAASDQVNQVTVVDDGSFLTVTDAGTDAITILNDQQCHPTADPKAVVCNRASKVQVFVRDLDDTVAVTMGSDLISELHGQNGTDSLTGGSSKDILKGGPGNDVLTGNDGNDIFLAEPDSDGDDQMFGGGGSGDLASYAATPGVTVDLGTTLPQNTGHGMDSFTDVENVNGSTTGADKLTGNAAPNTFLGSDGNDEFHVDGGGSDFVNCGVGADDVFLDRSDVPSANCETLDDGLVPDTTITSGPTGPTATPTWTFTSDEPWATFECADMSGGSDPTDSDWNACTSPASLPATPEGSSRVFHVRAVDDQSHDQSPAYRDFTIDTVAPDTRIDSGPSGGGVTTNPSPEFSFSSDDADTVGFLCRVDTGDWELCSSAWTVAPPLSDGLHTFEVAASDAAGNFDNTPAQVTFRVQTSGPGPGPGDGPAPNPQSPSPPQAQQSKIIIGSLVLIAGNSVKMSRKGKVQISLTCAGAQKCTGRLSITTAEPVSKRSRKLVTLGSKRFTIGANKKRKINLKFSKAKVRLAKRLKRFKAKALVREIDARGNPRISSRIFILRAR